MGAVDDRPEVAAAEPGSAALAAQIEAVVARNRRGRERRHRWTFTGIRVLSLALVLGAWQIYGLHTLEILFAPITAVVAAAVHLFRTQDLGGAIGYSLWTFAIGYAAGLVAGVAVGMLMAVYRNVDAAIGMYVYALYATPMVALVPLLSIWFGFGVPTQEVIIALFVLFPVLVTVYHGVRNIDPELLEIARSLCLNRRQLWRHVLLPGSLPFIAAGATQGVAMGLVGMFIAEIFTELSGIGNILETASQTYHTADALAALLVIMSLGVILRTGISVAQRRIAPWSNLPRK